MQYTRNHILEKGRTKNERAIISNELISRFKFLAPDFSFSIFILDPYLFNSIFIFEEMTLTWNRYQILTEPWEIDTPKNHLMFHINHRSEYTGNPWGHNCFEDESLNKLLKRCLRLCHQMNFEQRAFERISHLLAKYFRKD